MKKILVSFIAMMAVASSAWAAETMNMHDQVNNAQAPAHQMQSSAEKSAVQGESMKMMDMSGHDQAAMSHEMMQNGNSAAHQDSKRTARTVLTGMCYSVGSVMRQGSSSLTRLTGQSAMTSRTWRR